jgi:site-specific DNA-methyltransferase (adenine-specific)
MKTYIQKNDNIKYSDHWSTPKEIYNKYVLEMNYFDPCPLQGKDFDFIHIDKPVFLNPPYSDISKWVEWAITQHIVSRKPVVLLIPARTDTRYFHELLEEKPTIEFIKGRLKFGDSKQGAPFPSILVHLGEYNG